MALDNATNGIVTIPVKEIVKSVHTLANLKDSIG